MNKTIENFQNLIDYCHNRLNEKGLDYLKNIRHFTDKTIVKFKLGYFPLKFQEVFQKVDPVWLRKVGIVKDASFSVFSNRIIFPIYNVYGEPIAIAGRAIDDSKPKYFNSLYEKREHLYGLNLAIDEIRKTKEVYIVEGYCCVITAYQKDLKNIVAICGIGFREKHFILLLRYASKITIIGDTDNAGQQALRKMLTFLKEKSIFKEILINSVKLPKPHKDLDDYFQNHSKEDFIILSQNFNNLEQIRKKLFA